MDIFEVEFTEDDLTLAILEQQEEIKRRKEHYEKHIEDNNNS